MLETQGRVIAVEPGYAWVECVRQGGCGSCASKGSCGTQLLGEALSPGVSQQVRARDPLGVRVGDVVVLGITEEGGLRAAFLLYGLPVSGLLLGLVLGQPLGDIWAALAGGGGMLAALGAVQWFSLHRAQQQLDVLEPRVLACISSAEQGACASKIIPIKLI